jgi:hypothetical protein
MRVTHVEGSLLFKPRVPLWPEAFSSHAEEEETKSDKLLKACKLGDRNKWGWGYEERVWGLGLEQAARAGGATLCEGLMFEPQQWQLAEIFTARCSST